MKSFGVWARLACHAGKHSWSFSFRELKDEIKNLADFFPRWGYPFIKYKALLMCFWLLMPFLLISGEFYNAESMVDSHHCTRTWIDSVILEWSLFAFLFLLKWPWNSSNQWGIEFASWWNGNLFSITDLNTLVWLSSFLIERQSSCLC